MMRLSKLISLLVILFLSVTHANYAFSVDLDKELKPKNRAVTIKPITLGVINITPGRSVKIIFPWVLDESDSAMPYYGRLSSDALFKMEIKEGQNTILLYTDKVASNLQGEVTELAVSSRGFHFTFTLIADFNYKKHYSNIILKLGDKERMALLEDEKKRYLKALEDERQTMLKEIETKAQVIALKKVGELSQGSSSSSNVKEEKKVTFDNGDELVLYVDEVAQYGSFSIISIEIDNKSSVKALYLQDMKLLNIVKGGSNQLIYTGADIPPKLNPNQLIKTVVVTNEKIPDDDLSLLLITNRGNVEVQW